MLVGIDQCCFDVEFDYTPAHDGGDPSNPNSEESWPERIDLEAVCLAVPLNGVDLLPFLNQATITDIEKQIKRNMQEMRAI